MMDLDSAIQHCEEVAYQKDLESGFETDNERYAMTDKERADCKKCADEHRQLAAWLKELKAYREQGGDAISRQIISDYVGSHIQEINTGYGDINKHTNEILRMIVDYIESMPPATPQQRTGRWIKQNYGWNWQCSECGFVTPPNAKEIFTFCPNCGAKMESEE